MERETGIEPATNSLEGCDSTIELLPLFFAVSYLRCTTLCREIAECTGQLNGGMMKEKRHGSPNPTAREVKAAQRRLT
jgi:hypothetical protein